MSRAALMRRPHRRPAGRRGGAPSTAGDWVAACPAWGERYVRVFLESTLPALAEALRALARPCEILVWTDRADLVEPRLAALGLGGVSWRVEPPPPPDGAFASMSECHRQAMACALPGDRVLLLTADMVLSREVLATCEHLHLGGKKIVCCVAPRALEGPAPVGAAGRALMGWAWANRHPMTRDCTWPDGRSYDLWRMYFERDGEVAARVFLPHPLVVVPDRRAMPFGPTIDVNLAVNFSPSTTAFLTSPDEGAAVELSPPDKEYLKTEATVRERLLSGAESCPQLVRCANYRHRMFFGKKVILVGAGGDCGDGEVVARVMG